VHGGLDFMMRKRSGDDDLVQKKVQDRSEGGIGYAVQSRKTWNTGNLNGDSGRMQSLPSSSRHSHRSGLNSSASSPHRNGMRPMA
jgi:hypothetical protein